MTHIPTQQDLNILGQNIMNLNAVITIMDKNFKAIDTVQGELVNDSFTIDAESDIRRTFNLTLFVKDSSFYLGQSSKIWIDRLIKIEIVIKDQATQIDVCYPMGVFLFNEIGYKYSPIEKTLTLSCVDLMANLTGLRNGQVRGIKTVIDIYSDIQQTIIDTIKTEGKWDRYVVDPRQQPQLVPHDLNFSAGATVYDILSELNNLNAGWEMFFDTDGTFINQPIPTTYGEACVLDWQTIEDIVISENMNTQFSDVKNSTRVWGKCLDTDKESLPYTPQNPEANVLYIEVQNFVTRDQLGDMYILDGITILFKTPSVSMNGAVKIHIYSSFDEVSPVGTISTYYFRKTYDVVDEDGVAVLWENLSPDTNYVVSYKRIDDGKNGKGFLCFLGQTQIVYVVKTFNRLPDAQWIAQDKTNEGTNNVKYIEDPDNPFAIDAIGEIRQVLEGGEYEHIYTEKLAQQRAEYENWRAMRLNYELELKTKPIFWLDVNQKIQYKNKIDGKIEEYIIKSIDGSGTSGEMTIKAIKFYPLYPFIVE